LRVIIVSPTFGSNYKLLSELGISREDVFQEPDDDVPAKLIRIANDERDAFLEWKHLNEYYNDLSKLLRGVSSIDPKWMNTCFNTTIHLRINLSALNQSIRASLRGNLAYYSHS